MLLERYAGLAQGVGFPTPDDPAHDEEVAAVVRRLQAE